MRIDEARNLFLTRHNTLVSFGHCAAAKTHLWTQDEIGQAFEYLIEHHACSFKHNMCMPYPRTVHKIQ
jgi:hypothetical protein